MRGTPTWSGKHYESSRIVQRTTPAVGLFAEKQAWAFFAPNFNYRRNVSLDCQWFLISDERLHMSPLSNV